jgi:hypothetical protein
MESSPLVEVVALKFDTAAYASPILERHFTSCSAVDRCVSKYKEFQPCERYMLSLLIQHFVSLLSSSMSTIGTRFKCRRIESARTNGFAGRQYLHPTQQIVRMCSRDLDSRPLDLRQRYYSMNTTSTTFIKGLLEHHRASLSERPHCYICTPLASHMRAQTQSPTTPLCSAPTAYLPTWWPHLRPLFPLSG